MTAEEIDSFLRQAFPHATSPRIELADGQRARLRMPYIQTQLRPGGTLSGPTMMGLADTRVCQGSQRKPR